MTDQQAKLVKRHGTPAAFARAMEIAWSYGMITHDECVAAEARYAEEWKLAGKDDTVPLGELPGRPGRYWWRQEGKPWIVVEVVEIDDGDLVALFMCSARRLLLRDWALHMPVGFWVRIDPPTS